MKTLKKCNQNEIYIAAILCIINYDFLNGSHFKFKLELEKYSAFYKIRGNAWSIFKKIRCHYFPVRNLEHNFYLHLMKTPLKVW